MGQRLGRPRIVPGGVPFINLPSKIVLGLWEAYALMTDGWSLDYADFLAICKRAGLAACLGVDDAGLKDAGHAFFTVLDTDKNGKVDALELIATLFVISGLDPSDKLTRAFKLYDFSATDHVTIDEVALAFESTSTGLCKIAGLAALPQPVIESVAQLVFSKAAPSTDGRLAIDIVVCACMQDPAVASWVECFDDLQDPNNGAKGKAADLVVLDRDVHVVVNYKDKARALREKDGRNQVVRAAPTGAGAGQETPSQQAPEPQAWQASAAALKPSEPLKEKLTPPSSELTLEWVYGYSANEGRYNLRYTGSGDIVYHASSFGVVYKKPTEEKPVPWQEFNNDHHHEIVSFAVTPDRSKAATGEVGLTPAIIVWDASTLKTQVILTGFHWNAVHLLDFSGDGRLLLSVGGDDHHSMAVYDWAKAQRLFAAQLSRGLIFDARFAGPTGAFFATAGQAGLSLWVPKSTPATDWARQKGIVGKRATSQPCTVLTAFLRPNQILSASASGELLLWEGRNCVRSIKGHDGSVTALTFHRATSRLLSAGTDKRIRLWSTGFEPLAMIDTLLLATVDPIVRSLDLSADGRRMLVGTRGGEVFEVSPASQKPEEGQEDGIKMGQDLNGGAIIAGHKTGKVYALAVNAAGDEFVSVGEDKVVRTWEVATHKCKKVTTLDSTGRCVAYSQDGTTIAVGIGAGGKQKELREGAVVLLLTDLLTETTVLKDTHKPIISVCYAPSGQELAAGSIDHTIYMYALSDGAWTLRTKFSKHTGPVERMEFSTDGQWLRSCSKGEMMIFKADTGEPPEALKKLRDVEWTSETVKYTYTLQGLGADEDVTTVTKANINPLVAAGDASGTLRLCNYPTVAANAGLKFIIAHPGGVTAVRFVSNDAYLLSSGADHAVCQWALEVDEAEDSAGEEGEDPPAEEEDEEEDVDEDDDEGSRRPKKPPPESDVDEDVLDGAILDRAPLVDAMQSGDVEALYELGDQAKPEASFSPCATSAGDAHRRAPADNLTIDWVYGYAGQSQRSNVFYNVHEEVVYNVASVGVVYDKPTKKQKHFLGHTDAITASALHPDRAHVATGQRGRKPLVCIWSSLMLKATRTFLLPAGSRAVSALAFSTDGSMLAAASQDDNHAIRIYDWRSGVIKARAEGGGFKILALAFSPDNTKLLQGGVKHFKVWTVKGRSLTGKVGLFSSATRKQTILTVAWFENEGSANGVLGAANGSLLMLDGRKVSSVVEGHKKGLNSIHAYDTPDGTCLVSGGKDGKVKLIDHELNTVSEFKVPAAVDPYSQLARGVRSVRRNSDGRKLLIGTYGGAIMELSAVDGVDINGGPLVTGHWKHELRGLAAHPVRNECATVGGDRLLRLWELGQHKQNNSLPLGEIGASVAYAPNGMFVAVGSDGRGGQTEGSVFIVSLMEEALRIVTKRQDAKGPVVDIAFSPNGKTLAAASKDGSIYLYDVLNNFKLKATTSSGGSGVSRVDWSASSRFVAAITTDNQLVCFGANNADAIPMVDVATEKWATRRLRLDESVTGIYTDLTKVEHIHGLALSPDGSLLAAGDEYGRVSLYTYPATGKRATAKAYVAHGGRVSDVVFSVDGAVVLTIGAEDRALLQWRREREPVEAHPQAPAGDVRADPELATELEWQYCVTPSVPPPEVNDSASLRLDLEHVQGVVFDRGTRSNLFYTANGGFITTVAKLGVVYDRAGMCGGTAPQVIFDGHTTRELTCIDVSRDGAFVITGEAGPLPHARIWEPCTGRELACLPVAHRSNITHAVFTTTPDSRASARRLAATVGGEGGRETSLAVYASASGAWSDALLVAKTNLDGGTPLCVVCSQASDFQVMTAGVNHAMFWRLHGCSLSSKAGVWPQNLPPQTLLTATVAEGSILTGTQDGQLLSWAGQECVHNVAAHEGPVLALAPTCVGGAVSGGRDAVVKIWDKDLVLQKTVGLASHAHGAVIRSITIDTHQTKVAVGLKSNCVVEIALDTGDATRLLEGFKSRTIFAIAVHPADPDLCALVSGDQTVVVSSISQRKHLFSEFVAGVGDGTLAWSPDGLQIVVAVGHKGNAGEHEHVGKLILLSATDLSTVATAQPVTGSYVTDARFTPDGHALAAVYGDGQVVLYELPGLVKRWQCASQQSDVGAKVDFPASTDGGVVLRVCAADGRTLYCVDVAGEVLSGAPQGIKWASDGQALFAAPHESGAIKLWKKGATAEDFAVGVGHATGAVTAAALTSDGGSVLSAGRDGALMLWKVANI